MIREWGSALRARWERFGAWLAAVAAVDVGRDNDGLTRIDSAGTDLDKTWYDLQQEFKDALEAWRKNPLARRLVGIVTAYVVGGEGIRLRAPTYAALHTFLQDFYDHRKNQVLLKQHAWCDELSRSGELFLVLFTNPADGMSYIRSVPASRIERVVTAEGDYETEVAYHETPEQPGGEGRVWYSPAAPETTTNLENHEDGRVQPVMLHYAVNRPVGCVRGESDLAPVLPWLKRYSRWLEDRVRLNAAVRAFLWVLKVPGKDVAKKEQKYRTPPPAGSVIVVDQASEEWQAVTPDLQARDAASDGRAIRWMIVSGGPGIGLVDLGEAEASNLATATAMGELRRRFLRRRQAYFAQILVDVAVTAWNRAVDLGLRRGRAVDHGDVEAVTPDVAPEDNQQLASAAHQMAAAMTELGQLMAPSAPLRRLMLRLVLKFSGESVSDEEFEQIVEREPFSLAEAGRTRSGEDGSAGDVAPPFDTGFLPERQASRFLAHPNGGSEHE